MEWQWSLLACGISGIEKSKAHIKSNEHIRSEEHIKSKAQIVSWLCIAVMAFSAIHCASAVTIQAADDVQAAIDKANAGDTILVMPGQHEPFEVDKAVTIRGVDCPVVESAIQRPGITISADGAAVAGFKIKGVAEDSTSKFDYFMMHPAQAAVRLDLPNAGIIAAGNDISLKDIVFSGGQVGIFADGAANLSIDNATFERCGQGAQFSRCLGIRVENCRSLGCDKYGFYIERSSDIHLENCTIFETNNSGVFLKECKTCSILNNTASGNKEGITLWNSTLAEIRNNSVDHSYYGILVSQSDNNTILDNVVAENSRSEIVKGFGIGISLQENSSYNVVARNLAKKSFNGLEMTRGCKYNVIYGNDAIDNTHGIRVDKNYNNLIYHNNFMRNTISAYDNSTHNFWNASVGNFYSDYRGQDENGDGIGDQPYAIPKGNTNAVDARPLMKPCSTEFLDMDYLWQDLKNYARYDPEEENTVPYKQIGGVIKIESKRPKSPPVWPESQPSLSSNLYRLND
jgi:nitrous oxidase accessory protein